MKRVMKRAMILFGFLVFFLNTVHAREYIYPVAFAPRDSGDYIYLIHQISLKQLQLLQLDLETQVISPALPASMNPAGLKILPDNSGYSFIDQGSLYVKLFSKRSPILIDIPAPLYLVEMINWIDPTCCYFSAKAGKQFCIYKLSTSGQLDVLMQSESADCLYPQKIDEMLFYIERSFNKKNYSIQRAHYFSQNWNESFKAQASTTLLSFENEPIAFLHMSSLTTGYYISYPNAIDSKQSCLPCAYHQFTYDPRLTTWNTQKLFEFSIPVDFILPDSKDRLYESLLPLLPSVTCDGIYYCDCSSELRKKTGLRNLGGGWYEPELVKIYFYDFLSQKSTLKTHDNDRDLLAPLVIEKNVLYGHSIPGSSKNLPLLPGMWHNELGQTCYEQPKI